MNKIDQSKKKIRIAFVDQASSDWMGGLNYYKNLLFALKQASDSNIEPIVFVGYKTSPKTVESFSKLATVIQDSQFDRSSFRWYLHRISTSIFKTPYFLNKLIHKYNIDILSHANITMPGTECKVINWIPDFQHVHLPNLFPKEELRHRNKLFKDLISEADITVVSSNSAAADSLEVGLFDQEKIRVLQFVSQPSSGKSDKIGAIEHVRKKFQLPEKFLFLPNQFWKHKNHLRAFQAICELKSEIPNFTLVCTGSMEPDYRDPDYVQSLVRYITERSLEKQIRLLGLIEYAEVLLLMRHSIAVINPSLFEGWSSTVEECKSMGKGMILSDIPVHLEQAPPDSVYFDPALTESLTVLLRNAWLTKHAGPDHQLEKNASDQLTLRTQEFANNYIAIARQLIPQPSSQRRL